jgi:hypothetical protein
MLPFSSSIRVTEREPPQHRATFVTAAMMVTDRIMTALVSAFLARKMEADMLGKGLASKSALASARAQT